MEKRLLSALFALVVIFFMFAVFYYMKDSDRLAYFNNKDNKINDAEKTISNEADSTGSKINSDLYGKSLNEPAGKGSGSGAEDSGDNSRDNQDNTKQVPPDINTMNCGFYYSEYEICAGVCSEGKCISENRSCYCKK